MLITTIQKQIYNWQDQEEIEEWKEKGWLLDNKIQIKKLFYDNQNDEELVMMLEDIFDNDLNKFKIFSQTKRTYFELFRNRNQIQDNYANILYQVAKQLSSFFQKKQQRVEKNVVVIIDEYDNPLSSGLYQEISEEDPAKRQEARRISELINRHCKSIISEFSKEVEFIKKVVVIGIEQSLILASSGGFNDILHIPVNHHQFLNSFGFSEDDVEYLLTVLSGKLSKIEPISLEQLDLIKQQIDQWYNGYNICNIKKYNPNSIQKHLYQVLYDYSNYRTIPSPLGYWVNTGTNEILFALTKMEINKDLAQKLIYLSGGGEIKFNYNLDEIQSGDLKEFLLSEPMIIKSLINSGYLTTGKNENHYVIPNKEIKKWMIPKIFQYQAIKLFNKKNQSQFISEFLKNFSNSKSFQNYLQEILDNLQLTIKVNEFYFVCLIQGIFNEADRLGLGDIRAIPEEQQFHRKRTDHIFYPSNITQECIYIHEYKISRSQENNLKIEQDAIWQVYVNSYMEKVIKEIQSRNPETVKFIIIRIILFTNYNINHKWCVQMKEFRHTVEQARKLTNIFKQNNKLLQDHSILIKGKLSPKQAFRQKFLSYNNEDDIYSLLGKYSQQVPEQQSTKHSSKKMSSIQQKREDFRQGIAKEEREQQFQKWRKSSRKPN